MESMAPDLREMRRRPLEPAHVDALRSAGIVRTYAAGEMVADVGDPQDPFLYLLEGEMEVISAYTGERATQHSLGPGQFAGDISFLSGTATLMPVRACRTTRAIVVERAAMLDLMAQIPDMSDIVITVLAARRRQQRPRAGAAVRRWPGRRGRRRLCGLGRVAGGRGG